jgi:hypothetical protein
MPHRLSLAEKRKRLRALMARLGYQAADVDQAVNEALARALGEFRRVNADPVPPHIEATPQTQAEAAERIFALGFIIAATDFWGDIALGRERRETARKGGRGSASQRRSGPDFEVSVRSEAAKYRSAHPYSHTHSTRAMASSIGRKLRRRDSTVRAALSRLRIR